MQHRPTRRTLGAVALAMALVVGTTSSPEAIINGTQLQTMPDRYRAIGWVQLGPFFCTGTLVSPSVVLTAAHCVEGLAQDAVVRFTTGAVSVAGGGTTHNVVEWVMDHKYLGGGSAYDAAVLRLETPVLDITPMSLAPVTLVKGQLATAVGFGVDNFATNSFGLLHEGTVKIDAFDSLLIEAVPQPSMTCNGDSGGPLLVDVGGNPVQVGVTSFGDQRCEGFGAWTNVASIRSFVEGYINGTDPPPPPSVNGPVPGTDALTVMEDGTATVQVATLLANDIDPDGGALTFGGMLYPDIARCGVTECVFDFSAAPNLNSDLLREFQGSPQLVLPYAVFDDEGVSATGTLAVTITPVPDPPSIEIQAEQNLVQPAIARAFLVAYANDSDTVVFNPDVGGKILTPVAVTLAPGDGTGALLLSGGPEEPGFLHTYPGPGRYTVEAVASDGDGTTTRRVNLQITAMDVVNAVEGTAISFQPLTNDNVPAGAVITNLAVQQPAVAGFSATCISTGCTVLVPLGTIVSLQSTTLRTTYSYKVDGVPATGVIEFRLSFPQPQMTMTDVTVVEGNTTRTVFVPLALSFASQFPVTATYSTVAGTAGAGDFTSVTSSITIPAGVTSASIPVLILGDSVQEPNEQFTVAITGVNGALAPPRAAVVTLTNDDDNTAPVIAAKKDVIIEARLSTGQTIAVFYTAPLAFDAFENRSFSATCSPRSGSKFALGTWTIGCTATDFSGNTGRSTFRIIVRVPTTSGAVSVPGNGSHTLGKVAPGQRVRIQAGGFDPGTGIDLAFVTPDGASIPLTQTTAGSDGRFDATINIPVSLGRGVAAIVALGVSGNDPFQRGWVVELLGPAR